MSGRCERVKDFDLAIADRDASLNSTIAIDIRKMTFSSIPMDISGLSKITETKVTGAAWRAVKSYHRS